MAHISACVSSTSMPGNKFDLAAGGSLMGLSRCKVKFVDPYMQDFNSVMACMLAFSLHAPHRLFPSAYQWVIVWQTSPLTVWV